MFIGAVRAWGSFVGAETRVGRFVRRRARSFRVRRARILTGGNYAVFWGARRRERQLGIYLIGSCDLPAVFQCVPLLRSLYDGSCGILKVGNIADVRSDILVQSLRDDAPAEAVREIRTNLSISPDYFKPRLFERRFDIPDPDWQTDFEKDVVILSVAADAVRTVYRHRESGLLVDPGGWWLDQSKSAVLGNMDKVRWFRENFESVGRITANQFFENYGVILKALRERTGATILLFNTLTVEPGNRTHTYQLVRHAHTRHRREMNLALVELARRHDVSIVDVDRVLKEIGIRESQVDFAHFPREAYLPVAREVVRVLQERGALRSGTS